MGRKLGAVAGRPKIVLIKTSQTIGIELGFGPGDFVLYGDPAPPPQRGTAPPQFSAHICCGQIAAWIKMSLGMELDLGPGDFVLDGDPVVLSPKGADPQIFGPCLL